MNNLKALIIASILLITGCSTAKIENPALSKSFIDENNILHYQGELQSEAIENLFMLYQQSINKPSLLKIDSSGGDTTLGIQFGHWVFDNQLDVIVDTLCASSCANYIFPAAKQKILKKDSILIWHGGSLQGDVSEQILKGESFAINWRMQEWRFYNKININPILNVYGSIRKIPMKWYQYPLRLVGAWKSNYVGFDYSISDMKKFGLDNIVLLDGVWDWRKDHPKKDIISKQVMRITVTQDDLSSPFQ